MLNNLEIAGIFRKIAAAYQILDENRFKIIAYQNAADSIEHLTSEVKDFYDDGKLDEIPAVGSTIRSHLVELFESGKVTHFEHILSKVPLSIFPLLNVSGLGPKKAYQLVVKLKLENSKDVIRDLEKAAMNHEIAKLENFGVKSEADILVNLANYKKGLLKEKRMTLSEADNIARRLIKHLNQIVNLKDIMVLGSLRRYVATIGDIDIAIATYNPENVIDHFLKYPHQKIIERGPTGASILVSSGKQVDLRVSNPDEFGSMLQYFTGSKYHNIKLRSYALTKGFSLSEYGIKKVKSEKLKVKSDKKKTNKKEDFNQFHKFSSEKDFYGYLGMDYIEPELREDKGEIEAAIAHKLPKLIDLKQIKGDLHIHSDFNLEPSHDLGSGSIRDILKKAESKGYEYIGISDHNPSISNHSPGQIADIMKSRQKYYQDQYGFYFKNNQNGTPVKLFIMCEVDIMTDGALALPREALRYVDAVIASVHSSFDQDTEVITKRIIKGLTSSSKVKIFGHPTARLLGSREGINAQWKEIFKICFERGIALEINSHPLRLDLPDSLVRDAICQGLKLVINTDSHDIESMDMLKYGMSVARRGWAQKSDIINTYSFDDINSFLTKEVKL